MAQLANVRPLVGLLVAAPASGSGKTVLTTGLIAALTRRGHVIHPAKVGPDYIDTAFLSAAAGRPAVNLDLWAMRGALFDRLATRPNLVVEGVMGLFDGPSSGIGSSADVALRLDLPVLLVVNAERMSHSVAALVHGFATFAPALRFAGVILSRVASPRHEAMLREALSRAGQHCLGALPRDEALALPSRHLGLKQAREDAALEARIAALADRVEAHCDVDALAGFLTPAPHPTAARNVERGASEDDQPASKGTDENPGESGDREGGHGTGGSGSPGGFAPSIGAAPPTASLAPEPSAAPRRESRTAPAPAPASLQGHSHGASAPHADAATRDAAPFGQGSSLARQATAAAQAKAGTAPFQEIDPNPSRLVATSAQPTGSPVALQPSDTPAQVDNSLATGRETATSASAAGSRITAQQAGPSLHAGSSKADTRQHDTSASTAVSRPAAQKTGTSVGDADVRATARQADAAGSRATGVPFSASALSARPPAVATQVLALPPLAQTIAIAADDAFSFTYTHILEGWRAAGAALTFFSPLAGEAPDRGAEAVFLPGGYPELFAGRLAATRAWAEGLTARAAAGALVYGECGGYMALGDVLVDADGTPHAMAGLLPLTTSFANRRRHLGYRALTKVADALPRWPSSLRGHEFHYASVVTEGAPLFAAYDATGSSLGPMGTVAGNVAGSFAHIVDAA